MADFDKLEPLLPDKRVQQIAELLFLKYPDLPTDTDVFTFLVPMQHDNEGHIIPEQAVFALESDNPRAKASARLARIYKGKRTLTTAGALKEAWDEAAAERAHYVTTLEDPAWKIFSYVARTHLDRLQGLRELN